MLQAMGVGANASFAYHACHATQAPVHPCCMCCKAMDIGRSSEIGFNGPCFRCKRPLSVAQDMWIVHGDKIGTQMWKLHGMVTKQMGVTNGFACKHTWPKASTKTDFPAPLSPVMTFSPGLKTTCCSSTKAKFLQWHCLLHASGDTSALVPVQLASLVLHTPYSEGLHI